MNSAYAESIITAQRYLDLSTDSSHGFSHARRVAENVTLICKAINYSNVELMQLCAWWHDVGRLFDADHEELSGMLLYMDLKRRGVSETICEVAHHATRLHRWDMRPSSLEGQILRDADKLDFLNWDRWEDGIRSGQWESVRTKQQLLPRLRQLFDLEASKALYDQRITAFQPRLRQAGLAYA